MELGVLPFKNHTKYEQTLILEIFAAAVFTQVF